MGRLYGFLVRGWGGGVIVCELAWYSYDFKLFVIVGSCNNERHELV